MINVPIVTAVVEDIVTLRSNTLLACRGRKCTHALLLTGWIWIAELEVCAIDRSVRAACLVEVIILQHGSESTDLSASVIVATAVCDISVALATGAFMRAHEWRHLVLALLPHPHVLGIVAATAALVDQKLGLCTKSGSVLPAAGFGLDPCRVVQAAAHTYVGAAANAEGRVESPPKL